MHTYLHKNFEYTLKYLTYNIQSKNCLSLLIAISGGQDSIYLIKIIEYIKNTKIIKVKIEYIYIDHQWKQDSKYQIKHIINYIKSYKNPLIIYQIKDLYYSETKIRKLRYQIIYNHAINHNQQYIITGHTLTDKIETFFQNLFRGTSIDGATSLTTHRILNKKIQIVRPLININRSEIQWFCRYFCLPIWSDISNYYYKIDRNRIRHELIPYIKNNFSKHLEHKINSFLRISSIENEYIKQNTIKIYIYSRHKEIIAINHIVINKQHIAIQQRIIQLISFHYFNQCLEQKIIKKILSIINKKRIKQFYILWTNKIIHINEQWIYFR